jgi:hypothetical protein
LNLSYVFAFVGSEVVNICVLESILFAGILIADVNAVRRIRGYSSTKPGMLVIWLRHSIFAIRRQLDGVGVNAKQGTYAAGRIGIRAIHEDVPSVVEG